MKRSPEAEDNTPACHECSYLHHPIDAADLYKERVLALCQLAWEYREARTNYGDKWEDHLNAGLWVADPIDLLINVIEQYEEAGSELVRRIERWDKAMSRSGT